MSQMVPLTSLWMPILLSAVVVFIASSIVHMALTYHKTDFRKVPSEDQVMDALRKFNVPPGDYLMPCPADMKDMKSPAFLEKRNKGPVVLMTVIQSGPVTMGPQLVQWFVYSAVVSLFAAYLTSRAVLPGAPYLEVSRFASTVAFVGYALGQWPATIWYKRSLSTTLKGTFDGLLYGFLTGGVFGWLWPHA
jgi:hypothetical protein